MWLCFIRRRFGFMTTDCNGYIPRDLCDPKPNNGCACYLYFISSTPFYLLVAVAAAVAYRSCLPKRILDDEHKPTSTPAAMDDVWSWLSSLPDPSQWPSTPPSLTLASSADGRSICLSADRTAGSDSEALLTFSLTLHGFHPIGLSRTLWLSDPVTPSSLHISLLLQLLAECISTSSTSFPLPAAKLEEELAAFGGKDDDEQAASSFLCLVLLIRLFWLCATEGPADAGFLFFNSLDGPLQRTLAGIRLALGRVLLALGPDAEGRLMRSLGYLLCKWCILRELQGGGGGSSPAGCCPSYAAERHGLWVLKGFAPVPAMTRYEASASTGGRSLEAMDSVLHYALAHQQLEAVVQLEYTVSLRDPRFIRVSVRVDNVRLHVVRLRFGRRKDEEGKEEQEVEAELHFPSRARVWMGPELGASYATGPSLGRSSGNPERELEAARTVKGRFGGGKAVALKATARTATRARGRSWRWEQEAEGVLGVFEGVLCDGATGAEVAAWRPGGRGVDPRGGMRRRYSGWGRAFSKEGGVVVAGDELSETVEWRVGREMEGRVVRWRVGGRVWVSYFANEVKTGYYDTRSVEWREEVELAFVAA